VPILAMCTAGAPALHMRGLGLARIHRLHLSIRFRGHVSTYHDRSCGTARRRREMHEIEGRRRGDRLAVQSAGGSAIRSGCDGFGVQLGVGAVGLEIDGDAFSSIEGDAYAVVGDAAASAG